ncbi:MAG: WYL domain-containing protein [Oscillospiraceae bacterium]|nr:WYL domain-containing protein [Oscillospiraceae bacterium]
MPLFSEVYGAYFRTVERILQSESITKREIDAIIREEAFRDSFLFLPQKLSPDSHESWGLLKSGTDGMFSRITKNPPPQFVTTLQKRWLKSKLEDPKMRLFLSDNAHEQLEHALADVAPLCPADVFRCFDVFADGDCYESEDYRTAFRMLLHAVQGDEILRIRFVSGKGTEQEGNFLPLKLEYSRKNDKFRVFCCRIGRNGISGYGTINLGRIKGISQTGRHLRSEGLLEKWQKSRRCKEPVTVEVSAERNGIERFLMEFASFEKHTEWDAERNVCMVRLWYDTQDETELLIQLLGFGPVVEILGPPDFRRQAAERVAAQYALLDGFHEESKNL